MSCLTTRTARRGGDVTLVIGRTGGDVSISAQYTRELKVRTGILCPVGLGYEVLWSSEGILLHSENGCFFLEKRS